MQQRIYLSGAAYVFAYEPNTTHSKDYVRAGRATSTHLPLHGLFAFGALPQGRIQQATISLFSKSSFSGNNTSNSAVSLDTAAILAPWLPGSVTYNNMPGTAVLSRITLPQGSNANKWVTIDVTAAVIRMQESGNYGLALKGFHVNNSNTSNGQLAFDVSAARLPYLDITTMPSRVHVCMPNGAIKAGGLSYCNASGRIQYGKAIGVMGIDGTLQSGGST